MSYCRFHPGWFLALLIFWSGCASNQNARTPSSRSPIERLHIMSLPIALNLDQKPGNDGFSIKVYASHNRHPKAQPLEDGVLELLMFDGIATTQGPQAAVPLKSWAFTTPQLAAHKVNTAIGVGYNFTLTWDESRPQQKSISVIARYHPPSGSPLVSAPTTISVSSQ